MRKALLVLVLAIFNIGLFAQSDISGFRNWKWDLPFSQVSEKLTPSKEKLPRFDAFDKKVEVYNFEDVTAHLITYGFKDDKFTAVNISIYNKDLKHILKVFTKKYGPPKMVDTPFLKKYDWQLKSSDLSITYLPSKKGDKNTSIGISKKREKLRKVFK